MVSAHFWLCSISIHLSATSVTAGVCPFLLGHVAFLFVCLPALHCWCPPFSVGHEHFYSFVFQVCRCWCPAFLFISQVCHWRCPPFRLAMQHFSPRSVTLVSALFRWRCNSSIRLSPRSVTGGVRPFPLFHSFVPHVCHCLCPPLYAGHAAFPFICHPGLSLVMFALFRCFCSFVLFRWPCSIAIHLPGLSLLVPPLSVSHVAFLFMCLPGLSLVVSALFRWPCSISILLSPGPSLVCSCLLYSVVSQVRHCGAM